MARVDLSLPTEQLERLLDDVEISLTDIRAQLDAAKADFNATGRYSDPVWFGKATIAARHKGSEHQQIQRELGRRRRREGLMLGRFYEVCKEQLTEELFTRLADEAHERAEAA